MIATNGVDKIQLQYADISIDRFTLGRTFTEKRDASTGGGLVASTSYVEQSLKAKRLQSINFPNGISVAFVYSSTLRTRLANKIGSTS